MSRIAVENSVVVTAAVGFAENALTTPPAILTANVLLTMIALLVKRSVDLHRLTMRPSLSVPRRTQVLCGQLKTVVASIFATTKSLAKSIALNAHVTNMNSSVEGT